MKTVRLVSFALLAAFLVSCETKFTEYRGQGTIQGPGGTVRVVDGIDFWDSGVPDRKCRIMGVLEDDGTSDPTLAEVARRHGGNAIIHAGVNRQGNVDTRMRTKLLIVKYVE